MNTVYDDVINCATGMPREPGTPNEPHCWAQNKQDRASSVIGCFTRLGQRNSKSHH